MSELIILMGNSSQESVVTSEFPIQNYLNRGLQREEVIQIRRIWDSFAPAKDSISTEKIKKQYDNAGKVVENMFGSRQQITFDEFFQIYSRYLLQEKRKRGGDGKFMDSSQNDASCLFCPMTTDKGMVAS